MYLESHNQDTFPDFNFCFPGLTQHFVSSKHAVSFPFASNIGPAVFPPKNKRSFHIFILPVCPANPNISVHIFQAK